MPQVEPRFHEAVTMRGPDGVGPIRVLLTVDGPLQSLIAYFRVPVNRDRSLTWQLKAASAVGLMIDYLAVYRPDPRELYEELGPGVLSQDWKSTYLSRFVQALRTGTVTDTGLDPTGLFWSAASQRKVDTVVSAITHFSEFCERQYGTPSLNPKRPASFAEQLTRLRATDYRNSYSLFAHLGNTAPSIHSTGTGFPGGFSHDIWKSRATPKVRRSAPYLPFVRCTGLGRHHP
ncbi:MAG: hypothetical protein NTZ43_04150 [Gemmatimonadetes bacterium]|nr:hypothetical protein [Gemmatimonadota bacterium]